MSNGLGAAIPASKRYGYGRADAEFVRQQRCGRGVCFMARRRERGQGGGRSPPVGGRP